MKCRACQAERAKQNQQSKEYQAKKTSFQMRKRGYIHRSKG